MYFLFLQEKSIFSPVVLHVVFGQYFHVLDSNNASEKLHVEMLEVSITVCHWFKENSQLITSQHNKYKLLFPPLIHILKSHLDTYHDCNILVHAEMQ